MALMANSMKESKVREIIIIVSISSKNKIKHMVRGVHLAVRNPNLQGLRL